MASLQDINCCIYEIYINVSNNVNSKSLFFLATLRPPYLHFYFPVSILDPLLFSCAYFILFIAVPAPSRNSDFIANSTAEQRGMEPGIITMLFATVGDAPTKLGQ